jgi:hypothetical protein
MSRGLVVAIAVLVTVAGLGVAFYLGAGSFGLRQATLHEARLKRLVEKQPSAEVVRQALLEEGARDLPSVEAAVAAWPPAAREELQRKRARHAASRAFRVDEHIVYVLHYDREGVLRDFDFGPAPR